MTFPSPIVFCVALLLMVTSPGVLGQRGQPYIKKPAPAPVVPTVEDPDVQGNNGQLSGNLQVKATDDDTTRRIEELENSISTMKRENVQMQQAMNSLRMATINMQRTMSAMAMKMSELDKLANQNRELTRLLTYFETFFGVLYSEAPEAFDSTLPVETRLSNLGAYLGNVEAELAGLRPKPTVLVEPEPTGVSDELSNAVTQLSQQNAMLASKVSNLEQDVESTNLVVEEAKARTAGFTPGILGTGTCDCGETMESRLEIMENTVELLVTGVENAKSASGSGPSSKKAGSTTPILTEDDIDMWRAGLHESRGVSNSRKSVFSAVRHTHMIGGQDRKTLSFDSVHVNKGSNFQNNTVFVCTVEGFYFFHFTVRSYDGHYMGVALVKNSNMMTSVYTDASERSIMQSQSTVLHMSRGDEVWLELGSSERFAVHSDVHKYITFNGFLIYKGR